jgi:hypothetical protein
MKKIGIGIAALVCVAGMVYGATLQTAGNQEKSKMGNSTLVDIVNANDVALNAELANAATNVTAQTATLSATVAGTLVTNTIVYKNGSDAILTNTIIYVSAVPTATVAGVTTNVAVQRR